jgi:signal transduction histidine kinase/CheY-like chemotaxis protein/tetratricopeptide (TPR) repeat protein
MLPLLLPNLELGFELGRGAHSVVLRGRRNGSEFAVKLPLAAGTEAERDAAFRRFQREAVALARVRHPSLPAVLEVGRASGLPYLIMELVPGETLAERLARGPLPEAQVLTIAWQLADALEAIHSAGLVHRDVKARNVVFDSGTGAARLVDFGSAELARRSSSTSGTRAYSAPEVLTAGQGDAREDLHSLGRLLLESIGCVDPMAFPDVTPNRGRAELQSAGVSPELAEVILRLLAPDPQLRFPTASALRAALDRIGGARRGVPDSPELGKVHLHGRSLELERLRKAWADAQRAGRVVLVRGVQGVGKSHLSRAFLAELTEAGATVLTAACHPRYPRAFGAVRQLVDGYLRRIEALPVAERVRALARVRKAAGGFASVLKLLSPTVAAVFHDAPTVPSSENAEQAFSEGVTEFLEGLVREINPAVVFVDDVQWLDAGSRRVLSRVASRAFGARVLLLLTARTGDGDADVARLVETTAARLVRVELGPLGEDQVIELARDYLAAVELDSEIRRAIVRLSDGSPLSVLEVLRTLLDDGVLLPYWGRWQLDSKKLTQAHLPVEAASLLRRRIEGLEDRSRHILTVAAFLGSVFEPEIVARAAQVTTAELASSLADAIRAQLVEARSDGSCEFVHHAIRETLLSGCDAPAAASVHQRIAEVLDAAGIADTGSEALRFEIDIDGNDEQVMNERQPFADADPLYRLAFHYASGVLGRAPLRTAETNILAGKAAFVRFDNERAIEFFEAAGKALSLSGQSLDAETRLLLAEARVRIGALDDALVEFDNVLSSTSDVLLRASALCRVAAVHDSQFDSSKAWDALDRAFAVLGEELPQENVAYVTTTIRNWMRRPRSKPVVGSRSRARDEVLCSLYYQTTRVAFVSGKPGRLMLAVLRGLEPAERLGPTPALAKSYSIYAFVLTALGFSSAAEHYIETAERVAKGLRDPVIYSHTLQVRSVICAWGGRMQDALEAAGKCIVDYGYWRELNDYSMLCYSQFQTESVRGRDVEAWTWLGRAIERVNQHDGAPVVPEFLLLGARAALIGLGREAEVVALLHRLELATVAVPRDSGSYAGIFGPRIRAYTEKMDLGDEFERIVAEFKSLSQDPRRAHLMVVEYYVHVAHARVHACLRGTGEARAKALPKLTDALSDLKRAARIPLIEGHYRAVEGYHHWFMGRLDEARGAFAEAERLGVAETAPWVLYAVYRGRAHLLRAQGLEAAANDQAILAEAIAREHHSKYRARWIREEFNLRSRRLGEASDVSNSPSSDVSSITEERGPAVGGARARRQLRALLRISRMRAPELEPDLQARVVVDELVLALRAERGFLFLTPEVARSSLELFPGSDLDLVAGRDASGRDLGEDQDLDRLLIRRVAAGTTEVRSQIATSARRSTIAAPLVVDDVTAGVVYLDRPLADGVFTEADGEVLAALSGQVSLALELTRALRERERAQDNVRNTEKMEAVARLARGIAHDLNNMLSAIRMATMAMTQVPEASGALSEDIRTIQSALQRANELTRQLGAFSRGEFGNKELVGLNARIERLLPVIVGLVGETVEVVTRFNPEVGGVIADPDQIDQVLMNLVVNSRDAMPTGGRIVIETDLVRLDQAYAREHPHVELGRYVKVSLTDTGHGMESDTLQKIFEPYFTTKRDRGGTGLGLSSVYWIVSRSGGHIDVTTKVGEGTTFTLYFPSAERAGSPSRRSQKPSERETILLVEEDPISAKSFEHALVEMGYRVFSARTGAQALDLARHRIRDTDLLVTEVLMAGMNGLELARELRKLKPSLEILYLSSDTGGVLADRGILRGSERVEFLRKPVAPEALARRVRELLDRAHETERSP